MTRLRKGDTVIVITGADRGRTGRILEVDRDNGRVVVEGINMHWKHMRRSQEHPQGARIQRESPMQISNVAFHDAQSGKGVRLGARVEGGRKVRIMRPGGKPADG